MLAKTATGNAKSALDIYVGDDFGSGNPNYRAMRITPEQTRLESLSTPSVSTNTLVVEYALATISGTTITINSSLASFNPSTGPLVISTIVLGTLFPGGTTPVFGQIVYIMNTSQFGQQVEINESGNMRT